MFDIVAIAFVGTQEDMAETRESRRESRGNRATASNLIPEAGGRPTPATPVAIPSNVAAVAILNRSPEGGSMTRLIYFLATFMSLSAAIEFGQAQGVGDPKEGLALAQQVCSRCHATVAAQVNSPNTRAPRFPDLATTPGVTGVALFVALTTPHAGMPMFTFTGEQRDDIISYILSLL